MARRWSALGAAAAACALAGAASGGDAGPTISPVVFVGEEATGNAAGLTVGGTLFEMSRVTIDEAGLVSFQAADMATGTRFTARALPGLVQGLLRTGQVIATADGDFEVIDDGAGLETRGHSAEGRMYFRRTLRAVNNASDVRTALLRTSGSSVFTAMLPVESIGAGAGLMVADVITPPRVNREDEAAVVALGMDGAGGVREVLLVVDGIERRVIALEA
ncbi:MAG: hypothetical protein VYC34_02925, partial [Planctomycetota bacterium]|nr:hypothetical protein [Planctomycetota bacterium]